MPSTSDPRARELRGDEVANLVNAIKTPRVMTLERLQAFVEGTQYDGRPDFFSDDKPLQERAPNIVCRLPHIAVESNVAFAMGEGRFPAVLSMLSENDRFFDSDLGLSDDESKVMDAFNARLIDVAALQQVFRGSYRMALSSRSVAMVLGFRNGLPFADLIWSKLCFPTFGDPSDPTICTRLEIRYRYTQPWRDPMLTGGKVWTRVFEYLRIIDDTNDTVYEPVPVWDISDRGAVEGQSQTRSQVPHGFGFCPVHWYAHERASVVGDDVDGKAVHDGSLGLIEQLDLALSQRHRAALYAGDPQLILIGVNEDDAVGNTGASAQSPMQPLLDGDRAKGSQQWQRAFGAGQGGGKSKLRRGAGEVWRITDAAGKAVLLTLPSDALDALDKDAKDLLAKICDIIGVTIVDPASVSGAGDLSGRTLSFLFSKQINRVSQDREDLGRRCILPVLNLFYRMLLAKKDGVYLAGADKVRPILQRFYRPVTGAPKPVWFCPQLKLKWGDYFEPSDMDEKTRIDGANAALAGGIITTATAVEHVRGVFQISSVDQYVKTLEDEKAKKAADRAKADSDKNAQMMSAMKALGGNGKPGQPPPASNGGGPSAKPDGSSAKAPPPAMKAKGAKQ